MNCPKCNAKISMKQSKCEMCGLDLSLYKKIFSLSNYYYNEGLSKAKVRDLSGAVIVLRKSLELNKKNTKARNLLGLVYFELGETVAALSSWVISKHFQPENNMADDYLKAVQKNATQLDNLNQTIKKYNTALRAAQGGNADLAVIQLKKVVAMNPHYVSGMQLLALLYMKRGEYEKAKKYLNRAAKIDVSNTKTLTYLSELASKTGRGEEPKKISNANLTQEVDAVTYENSKAFRPTDFEDERPNIRAWLNLIIGAAVGIACGYLLFIPATKKNLVEQYNSSSLDYHSEKSMMTAQVSSLTKDKENLQSKVDELQATIDESKAKEYDAAMYDDLFEGVNLYISNLQDSSSAVDYEAIAKKLGSVKESALENKTAKEMYDVVKEATFVKASDNLYEEGHNAYSAGKYNDALDILLEAYKYNPDDENTIYFIGRSYHRLGENEKAKKYYNLIIKKFSDTARYSEAKQQLASLGD